PCARLRAAGMRRRALLRALHLARGGAAAGRGGKPAAAGGAGARAARDAALGNRAPGARVARGRDAAVFPARLLAGAGDAVPGGRNGGSGGICAPQAQAVQASARLSGRQGGSGMLIRRYAPGDLTELLRLFYDTVHTVNAADYTPRQLDA